MWRIGLLERGNVSNINRCKLTKNNKQLNRCRKVEVEVMMSLEMSAGARAWSRWEVIDRAAWAMKVACTVRSGGKQRKPHSRQRPCGTNNIRHREMLDDIYILQDCVNAVNNKILNVATSCIIRKIVTYHYTSLTWATLLISITKN